MTAQETLEQVLAVTTRLISLGLCNEQYFPKLARSEHITKITIPGTPDFSASLRNTGYRNIYEALYTSHAYNLMMLDGGLIQMLYTFTDTGRSLQSHHLAYFPSPDFEAFQNDEELYLSDEIYADILQKSILPCPLRFDYDSSSTRHIEVYHPKSHLTIGQYENCRVPVSAALTPIEFIAFLLRCFYGSAYRKYEADLSTPASRFEEVLTIAEQSMLHIRLCHPKHATN